MDTLTLYRGVSERFFIESNGQFMAKGYKSESEITADNNQITADNTFITIHPSIKNTAILHNICSTQYPSIYISTTTDIEVAKKFATTYHQKNIEEYSNGYIFELVVPKKYCYSKHNKFAVNSEEREVLVNLEDFNGIVPDSWIVRKEYVVSENLK